jgi:RNA polymerase sigma-B factor
LLFNPSKPWYQLLQSKIDPLIIAYNENKTEALKTKILENYQHLAIYIAKKFAYNRSDIEELIQIANIAILKAIERFDTTRNISFSTFLTPTIIGEIKHFFRDKSPLVKIPRKLQEINSKVKTEIKVLQSTGIRITTSLLSKRLQIEEDILLEAMEAESSSRVISLDNPNNRNDFFKSSGTSKAIIDTIESTPMEEHVLIKETLKQALLNLHPRERRICYLRFYGGLSQTDIANRLELSQMHISRILNRTIKQLRKKITL